MNAWNGSDMTSPRIVSIPNRKTLKYLTVKRKKKNKQGKKQINHYEGETYNELKTEQDFVHTRNFVPQFVN